MTATRAVEPGTNRAKRFDPVQVGWRIGVGHQPKSGELWCPWDRTAGVIGPQGSGKTLDLLTPALINAPGAAMVTLTKPDDLLLSLPERSKEGRPCVVLDPFGLVPGQQARETGHQLVRGGPPPARAGEPVRDRPAQLAGDDPKDDDSAHDRQRYLPGPGVLVLDAFSLHHRSFRLALITGP